MKNYFMIALLFAVGAHSQTQTYTASTEIFANPERGFYHYRSTGTGTYKALNQSELTGFRTNEKVTLIWREFMLSSFKTTAISADYLAKMQTDFNLLRNAGVKAIIRFNYTNTDGTDANRTQVLAHIAQLKPVIIANEDVISSVEAGFIGNYGEWWYSNNFGTDDHTATNTADRIAVGNAIMTLAPNRMVAFRTPTYQRLIAGSTPVSATTAYNGSITSRIAAHNDCFLSSSDDYGTYTNTTTDPAYLESQSRYTFDGGETCSLTTYSACSNAQAAMKRFHFNYLNADYNQEVTSNWQTNGCLDEVKRKLGYRFELLNSNITTGTLTINLQNTGYANVFNARDVYVVARNTTTGAETPIKVTTNIRLWSAGSTARITQALTSLPNGTYQLYLNLPDSKLATNPIYSIRFANANTWDATKGYNNLNLTYTKTGSTTPTPPVVVTPTPTTPTPTTPTTPLAVVIFLDASDIIQATNLPCTAGNFTVAVYNTTGRLKATTMDISSLKKGIYTVKITCNGTVYTKKISKTTGSW
jgi:hypothetical protein